MSLAETLGDAAGVAHPMVGVLPAAVRLEPRRMALGYAEVVLTRDTPIGPARAVARGHEFHYSTLDPVPAGIERVYRVAQRGAPARAEGYLVGRTLMSYIDRKSTRLNSSHSQISYAVFCLKKKKNTNTHTYRMNPRPDNDTLSSLRTALCRD